MPRKKKLTRTLTRNPQTQVIRSSGQAKLSKDEWANVASDCWQSIISLIGTRAPLEANLRTAYALTERDNMDGDEQDDPYVESSDLTIPLVFSKLQAVKGEVMALTFVPEFYLISGFGEKAQAFAPDIQARWNWDFRRIRNPYMSWFEAHDKWLHQGLRDGLSILEASWVQDKRMQTFLVHAPVKDATGAPVVGPDGQVQTAPEYATMEVTVYDGVVLQPFLLKDVLFAPNEAESDKRAAAVWVYHRYYRSDLAAMAEDGIMDEEWVNAALNYDPQGYSDIASRFQGIYNYTAGGQLNIGIGQGQGMASKSFAEEGPLGVWVGYSTQFDFDGDEIPEPNIIFIHEISGYMLGHTPDGNMAPIRLLFALAPFPRCDSIYGYMLPELVGPFQREATLNWNQRNDAVSTRLEVPLLIDTNVELKHSNYEWGNGKVYQVKGNSMSGGLRDVLWYPQLPEVPLSSFQQEQQIYTQADAIVGLGQGGGGERKSAAEIKTRSADSDIQANLIASYVRLASRQVFEAIWSLTLQYGFNDDGTERSPSPGQLPFTKDMLSLPYKRQIAGEDDPLDKQAALDEYLGFYKSIIESPFVQSSLVHRYNLDRGLAGKFGAQGLDGILGTPQEAMQMQQQQQQAGAEKAELEKKGAEAKILQMLNRGRGANSGMPLLDKVPNDLSEPPPQQGQPGQPGQQQPGQPPGGPPQNGQAQMVGAQ